MHPQLAPGGALSVAAAAASITGATMPTLSLEALTNGSHSTASALLDSMSTAAPDANTDHQNSIALLQGGANVTLAAGAMDSSTSPGLSVEDGSGARDDEEITLEQTGALALHQPQQSPATHSDAGSTGGGSLSGSPPPLPPSTATTTTMIHLTSQQYNQLQSRFKAEPPGGML